MIPRMYYFIFVGIETPLNSLLESILNLNELTYEIILLTSLFLLAIRTLRAIFCHILSTVKALLLYTILRRENEVI
jgi:hypothetical protein